MKSINKGGYWSGTISHINRATLEIAEERHEALARGSTTAKSQNKCKLRVLQGAQQLAETFLDVLKEGDGMLFA
eukprot:4750994-Prorocentrum_lima.AAC.1